LDEPSLASLSSTVGQLVGGLTVAQAKERVGEFKTKRAAAEQELLAALSEEFEEMLAGTTGDHVLVHGVANLAGEAAQWHLETTQRLVEALERESEMLTLLREAGTQDLSVMIGGEHPSTEQWDATVIAAPYRAGDTSIGAIGIVGPTRMDYLTAISAVKAVARRISDIATEQEA
jgi:heat-inducible transcriptional repressor